MAWISVHESIDGPKLRNLYKQLGCSKFEATGILNFLWFWGLTNAERDGLILYAEKEDIERYLYGVGAGCVLDPKKIVDALFDSGWLDWSPRGICIHDWETWQAQWQKAKDARERDAARKRESRRNSKAAAQNEEKADAAKDGHTDGPADGEEKQLKIDEGEPHAAEKAPTEPPEPPKPPAEPATPKYTPTFDEFWDAYPKKAEKGNAFKKYQARIHEGFSPEELLMAARNYATQCKRLGTEKQYIKHPKTFLSDSRPFLDYLPDKKKAQPPEDTVPDNKNPFAEYGEE